MGFLGDGQGLVWFGLVWSMAFSMKRFLFHYRNTYYSIGYYLDLVNTAIAVPAVLYSRMARIS